MASCAAHVHAPLKRPRQQGTLQLNLVRMYSPCVRCTPYRIVMLHHPIIYTFLSSGRRFLERYVK